MDQTSIHRCFRMTTIAKMLAKNIICHDYVHKSQCTYAERLLLCFDGAPISPERRKIRTKKFAHCPTFLSEIPAHLPLLAFHSSSFPSSSSSCVHLTAVSVMRSFARPLAFHMCSSTIYGNATCVVARCICENCAI